MLKKLGYLMVGMGTGAVAHKAYTVAKPPQHFDTAKSNELVQNYVQHHKLEKGDFMQMFKALGVIFKSFYVYGMEVKLEGFNFNTTYMLSDEMDGQHDITRIFCIFSPTDSICGHPGIQHGGATATIIDNTLGYLAWVHAKDTVATASLSLKYKRPVLKDELYVFEGQVDKREGRRIEVSGKIRDLKTGEIKVETEAVFMTVVWNSNMSNFIKTFFKAN